MLGIQMLISLAGGKFICFGHSFLGLINTIIARKAAEIAWSHCPGRSYLFFSPPS